MQRITFNDYNVYRLNIIIPWPMPLSTPMFLMIKLFVLFPPEIPSSN